MKFHTLISLCTVTVSLAAGSGVVAQELLTTEQLRDADYMRGKQAFQGRCSACHTLADSSGDIAGPNLWGVFEREVGSKEGFSYSPALKGADFNWTPDRVNAWLADPQGYLPGNIMAIPEAVPENLRVPMISFMMIETGAVDWPRPESNFAEAQTDRSLPPSERFPSFWNHLMFNTTRYRWEGNGEEFKFDAYFKTDGSVATNQTGVEGFWHITEKDFFCYALKGMPVGVGSMVECFPVAAMAIPRFADELWASKPQEGVKLYGGIRPGRPDWVYGGAVQETGDAAHPGYWENLYKNTMRYKIAVAENQVETVDVFFDPDGVIASADGSVRGAWTVTGEDEGEQQMCYTLNNVNDSPGELHECFRLELMFNPRIGARWPSKFDNGVGYWCEVVEGRQNT